jgi:hypothetical protein
MCSFVHDRAHTFYLVPAGVEIRKLARPMLYGSEELSIP